MKIEFTDRRDDVGTIHGDPWQFDYDGFFHQFIVDTVNRFEEMDGKAPVVSDNPEVENTHSTGEIEPEYRLKMLFAELIKIQHIKEMRLIIDGEVDMEIS